MTQLTRETLGKLLGVAITSRAETEARIDQLKGLAEACSKVDDPTCGEALTEAVRQLAAAASPPGADAASLSGTAHSLGRTAEGLDEPTRARAAYVLAARLAEATGGVPLGVIWHDIGDTWRHDGDGQRALASYREAAAHKARDGSAKSHLMTLRYLADAEDRWGTEAGCEQALEAALERISREVHRRDAEVVARLASSLAREAERLNRPSHAQEARRLAVTALDPSIDWDGQPASPPLAPPGEAIELLERGRADRRSGALESAQAHLTSARDLLAAAGMAGSQHLVFVLRELRIVERALTVPVEILRSEVAQTSATRGDLEPALIEKLEALAAGALADDDRETARRALEWALAIEPATHEGGSASTLQALQPLLDERMPGAEPDALPPALLHDVANPHRVWAFDLRRRAVATEDIRALITADLPELLDMLVDSWARTSDTLTASAAAAWLSGLYPIGIRVDEEMLASRPLLIQRLTEDVLRAWDEREGLGEELTRALERYLLVTVIEETWPKHQDDCIDEAQSRAGQQRSADLPGRELAVSIWKRFITLFFAVEVEVDDKETAPPPTPPPAAEAAA